MTLCWLCVEMADDARLAGLLASPVKSKRELEAGGFVVEPDEGEILGGREPGRDQRFLLELVRFVLVLDRSKLNEFSLEPYVDTDCSDGGRGWFSDTPVIEPVVRVGLPGS